MYGLDRIFEPDSVYVKRMNTLPSVYATRYKHGMTTWTTTQYPAWLRWSALGGLIGLAACNKQETPPPPTPVITTPAEVTKPQPKKEFNDPALQARYETEFGRKLADFAPPERGSLLALRLNDGSFIGGVLSKVEPEEVTLRMDKESLVANKKDIDPNFLPEVYDGDFARQMAMEEIEAPTNLPPTPVDTRFSIRDDIICHTGPGSRYQAIADISITRGTKINIWQRRGRWLLAGTSSNPQDRMFWVDYFQTMSLVDKPNQDYTPYILILLEHGILARLNPEQNEAFVNADAWVGTDSSVQEGMSRVLAAHFAQVRKTSVVWAEIKSEQGKRLARYTRAQGFRAL